MITTAEWFKADTTPRQERLVEAWPEAPIEQLTLLKMVLSVAREQVTAFAPIEAFDLTDIENPKPAERLVYAQLQQTINLWNAGTATPAGEVGPEGFSYTPRPLDKTIRSIIRPQSGVPSVF